MNLRQTIVALLLIFSTLIGAVNINAASTGELPDVNRDIEQLLQTEDLKIKGATILTRTTLLELYQAHDFAPYWTSADKVRELMELIATFKMPQLFLVKEVLRAPTVVEATQVPEAVQVVAQPDSAVAELVVTQVLVDSVRAAEVIGARLELVELVELVDIGAQAEV